MKSKRFIILTAFFLLVIFFTQFKLINRPVADNDEGIYLTSFLLVDKGYPAYKQTYFSQPPGFLLTVYPGFILFGKTLQAARLTISLWTIIGLLAILWLSFEFEQKWAGLLAIGLLFLIPSYYNQTLTFQSDILITTFSLLSFAFLIKFGKTLRLHWFAFSVFFLNLTFWTKFDITFFPSFILFFLILFRRKTIHSKDVLNLLITFSIVSLGFIAIFIFPFGLKEVFYNSILLRFQASSSSSSFMLFGYLKKEIVLSLVFFISIFLIFLKKKSRQYPINIILLWSTFIFILLLFYRPLFPHHLAIFTVPMVFLFSQLTEDFFKDKKLFKSIVIIVMIISLSNRIYQTTTSSSKLINDQQQKAVEIIKKYSNINDVMVSDDEILNGLSGRLPPPELSDISFVRIRSNNLSPENFRKIIKIYKPKLIIPWNGRLESMKNFRENLAGYKILTSFSATKNIYIRIAQ